MILLRIGYFTLIVVMTVVSIINDFSRSTLILLSLASIAGLLGEVLYTIRVYYKDVNDKLQRILDKRNDN